MKRPLVGLVLMFALGIWAGTVWPLGLLDLTLLTAVMLLVFLVVRHSRWALVALLLAVASAGMLTQQQAVTPGPLDLRRLVPAVDQVVRLRGVVVSSPTETGRFQWRISALDTGQGWQRAAGLVLGQVSIWRRCLVTWPSPAWSWPSSSTSNSPGYNGNGWFDRIPLTTNKIALLCSSSAPIRAHPRFNQIWVEGCEGAGVRSRVRQASLAGLVR